MLLKSRTESEELLKLRSLNSRMELTAEERYHFLNLEKGFEGEVMFDRLAETLQEELYIINDLLLKIGKTYFQIDSLLILQNIIRLIEIKNFEGDFCLKNDKFFAVKNDREYKNPIEQLKKAASLLRQILQTLKMNYLVEASLVFINPGFTLYNVQVDQPIILPNQVNRFLQDINKTPSKLGNGHKQLAQQLLSLHQTNNPFSTLPHYDYDDLQKGIYCKSCGSFTVAVHNHHFLCAKCGRTEKVEEGIMRSISEFQLLFPERQLTTGRIHEWCNSDLSRKTIYRVLKKNFIHNGKIKDSYYF